MNPLFATDFYKVGHGAMYPNDTEMVYNNTTPRKSRIEGIDAVTFVGLQYFIKEYLIKRWNEHFFNKPLSEVLAKYLRMTNACLGPGTVRKQDIIDLHNLGYLPIEIKALPEGASVPMRVPVATKKSTHKAGRWVCNYLETILNATIWQPITSATLAKEYKRIFSEYALETVGNTDFVPFQGHDFSFRGMSSYESSCTSGLGHLTSFVGTDTIAAIEFAEDYFLANVEKELVGCSVPATEHMVAAINILSINPYDYVDEFIERTPAGREKPTKESVNLLLVREYGFLKQFITKLFPNGIASYVSDTYNIFAVVTEILPRLKPEIMARTGGKPFDRLVIRPDSFWTNPVDCLCGYDGYHPQMEKLSELEKEVVRKGLVESLWDIFGGTVSEQGYKILDPHIGCIYGDSISLNRAKDICYRLKNKGFASINWLAGIGSYTYQYNTRDTFGLATKGTFAIVGGEPIELFKDPVSDDGMKKSAKGLLRVDKINGVYTLKDQCTPEEEAGGELKTVFKDGKLLIDHSLAEIRQRVNESL